MTVPIVLVTSDRTQLSNLDASATPVTYLDAVALAGLTPVQLPTIAEPFAGDPLLEMACGVVATGARSNVHPGRYGAAASEEDGPFDEVRDGTSLPLIRAALDAGLPLLAICRGFQELNVVCGGTLHTALHDVAGKADHRGADSADMDERYKLKHDVIVQPGGMLSEILGAPSVLVNSVHRQGVDRLGDGLTVEAVAQDGTVEAVSVGGHPFALGVQWHPEYWVRSDAPSRALFDAFADAARAHAARRERRAAA